MKHMFIALVLLLTSCSSTIGKGKDGSPGQSGTNAIEGENGVKGENGKKGNDKSTTIGIKA